MTAGMIHLNTAGAGLPAPGVTAAMTGYLEAEATAGPYEAEQARADDLTNRVYAVLADLVGAQAEHIALFASATDAWCRIACHLTCPREAESGRPRTSTRATSSPCNGSPLAAGAPSR